MILNEADFEYLQSVLRSRAGLMLERRKSYLVESRLGALARVEGLSLPQLLALLRQESQPALQQRVIEAMTTNETFFFRDIHPFDALREFVLPELMQRRSTEREVRIWSGACSSGQELYSVAMIVRDHFPSLIGWELKLLGTDLSGEMIERARRGRYSPLEISRGLTPELLGRHFQVAEGGWQLRDTVRRMAEYRTMNLLESWGGLAGLDVVLLRNVLIYLDLPSRRSVLARVRQAMRPDGYLILGSAETTLNLDEGFEVETIGRATCYRLAGRRA